MESFSIFSLILLSLNAFGDEQLNKKLLYTCCAFTNQIKKIYDPVSGECKPLKNPEYGNSEANNNSDTGFPVPSYLTLNLTDDLKFRFVAKTPNCERTVSLTLHYLGSNDSQFETRENRSFIRANGFLNYYDGKLIPPESFCINSAGAYETSILLCDFRCEFFTKAPCIRKCCPLGELLDMSIFDVTYANKTKEFERGNEYRNSLINCISGNMSSWKPEFYYGRHNKLTAEENSEIVPVYLVDPPKEWCPHGQIKIRSSNSVFDKPVLFRVLSDGRVIKKNHRLDWEEISINSFCIDTIGEKFQSNDTILIECEEESKRGHQERSLSFKTHHLFEKAIALLQFISACFLLATAIVYTLLRNPEHVQKSAFTNHVSNLFVEYLCLVAGTIYTLSGGKPGPFCYAIALVWHYVSLAAACWLFVINLDFFWEFHSIVTGKTGRYSMTKKRSVMYWTFCSSVPTIIVGTGLILNSTFGNDIESEVLIPLYGQEEGFCGLERYYAILVYLYAPFGFLLFVDVVLLTSATFYLKKIEKLEVRGPGKPNIGFRGAEKVEHVFRILMVVGITYLYEITYWAVGDMFSSHWYIWVPFEVIHGLHGIQIFFALVWIRPVLDLLFQRHPRLMACCGSDFIIDKLSSEKSSDTRLSTDNNEILHSVDGSLFGSNKELNTT